MAGWAHFTITMQLVETAYRWMQYTRRTGCRFDLEKKAAQSVAFVLDQGGKTFALPSKLEGVSKHQDLLDAIEEAGALYQPLKLHAAQGRVLAVWHGAVIGHIRTKHLRWIKPLLATGCIRCFVLQVTDSGHRYKGCNIVIAGIGAALDVLGTMPQPRDEQGRFLPKSVSLIRERRFAYRVAA